MGKGKKAFIDRKKAVTFHLVHRSQHDPLITDETAPQRVLVEAGSQHQSSDGPKRLEEQRKYGINFDDDYDYLQHLKEPEQNVAWEYVENPNHRVKENVVVQAAKLNLPSSVFASEFEEDEGMLNKAAPQPGPHPEWDPDVVAALDGDFDFSDEDNELEDDFVVKAMAQGENENEDRLDEESEDEEEVDFDSDDLDESDDENDSEIMDRLAPLMREKRFADEETKSRFTEYSMSSSVIRRNEQLSLLDDRFEHFYASYDDPELGDLPCEDISGTWHQKHPYVINCYKQFKKSKQLEDYNKDWDRERIKKYEDIAESGENPEEELIEYEVKDPKEKWDCESIISTYSNIYNHPKVINEPSRGVKQKAEERKIEIDPKTGLPTNILRGGEGSQLTAKALTRMDNSSEQDVSGPKSLCAKSVMSTLSVLSIRPKDETPEEKRERKRLLKEYRNERRIEKKANTQAFKDEKKRQTHVKINQRVNQQGTKIL